MTTDEAQGQQLPEVRRVEVNPEELAQYTTEHQFNGLAVDLMIECGSWVCIAACLLPGETKKWNRNQAILGGLLVRFYKLASALLDQTCQHRRETTFIFARLAVECLVNIQYLIEKNSNKVFDAYVIDSLRHEKKLHDRIQTNIERRNGIELPIERRMLDSIDRTLTASGVSLSQISTKAASAWRGVTFYERADTVGLGDAYHSLFGGPSRNIHGAWQDLLEYHLQYDESGFSPVLDWHRPRPQVLLTIARFAVETVKQYLPSFSGTETEALNLDFDDLLRRIALTDQYHEIFLSLRQNYS